MLAVHCNSCMSVEISYPEIHDPVTYMFPSRNVCMYNIACNMYTCIHVSDQIHRRALLHFNDSVLSGTGGILFVPVARTSTRRTRAFSVVGPSVWNGLTLALRLLPRVHSAAFYSSLKTALLSRAGVGSASE